MQPYVIRKGDHLASLAYQFGFDADTVWNDDSNSDLRQNRPDPNILNPGEVLYIPDPPIGPPPATSLTPGSTNSFVADAPTLTVTHVFSDPSLASQAFTVQELPDLTGQTSGGDGTVTLTVPPSLTTATIVFTDSGATFVCQIGFLDPINQLTGVFQRLQNLGYIDPDATFDTTDIDAIRSALRDFKASQSSPDPSGDAGPSSVPYNSPPPGSSSAPPPAPSSSSGASASGSDPPPAPASTPAPASAPASSPAPASGGPPPSAPPSSAGAPVDDAGLSDGGQLDDATSSALLAAHGS
jgi:hypothetical protein